MPTVALGEIGYSGLIKSRLAQLTAGLVDDCERLAKDRETELRAQCEKLQKVNLQLRSRLNQGGLNLDEDEDIATDEKVMPAPEGEALAQADENNQSEAKAEGVDAADADGSGEFKLVAELMHDAVAGGRALAEDYWLANASRPDHDQGFFDTGSTHHEIDLESSEGYVLNPSSHWKLVWDILGIPVLAWDLITIPMQVFNIGDTPVTIAMGWVTLIFWTIDIFVTFLTGFFDNDGELVMQVPKIARHYLKGSFSLDFLIIGADWLSIFLNSLGDSAPSFLQNVAILRAFRITRVARLTRLSKLKAKWQTVEDNIESETVLVFLTLFTKIVGMLALNHYVGCVWYALGNTEIEGYDTWLSHHPYPQFGDKADKLSRAPWGYKYITALHWAITQFTPGSMHVQAQNIPERIFSIFMILFGLVVLSSFIAAVTQARMQLNKMMSKFQRDLWLLRKYCRQHKVSHGLVVRMRRYVDHVVVPKFQEMSASDVILLPQLSSHLRDELATELAAQNLHLHPFFQELIKNKAVMTKVCTEAVKNLDFARGDVVFNAGQVGHTMYVVAEGVLEYIPHMKHHVMEEIPEGGVISEAALWTNWTLQGQLQASVECTCMLVDAAHFRRIIAGNTLVMAFARRYAFAFLDGMNQELRTKGMPCDLQQKFTMAVNLKSCVRHSVSPDPKANHDDNAAGGAGETQPRRVDKDAEV